MSEHDLSDDDPYLAAWIANDNTCAFLSGGPRGNQTSANVRNWVNC